MQPIRASNVMIRIVCVEEAYSSRTLWLARNQRGVAVGTRGRYGAKIYCAMWLPNASLSAGAVSGGTRIKILDAEITFHAFNLPLASFKISRTFLAPYRY